jgi:2-polyprenyl-3-methyl-5-hydroxy-6-metoxy-1,4-benzoquinol methylase
MDAERFDEKYFHRWYRDPRHRVKSRAAVHRQALLAVSAAEWVLDRPLRNVLDVGAGVGDWARALASLRPRARYSGIDPSTYAVERHGERWNISLGGFGDVHRLGTRTRFDLVVCSGVAAYVSSQDFVRGLSALARITRGVLHLEIFTSRDDIIGDQRARSARSGRWYRSRLRRAGFVSCGFHNYVGPLSRDMLAEMEGCE